MIAWVLLAALQADEGIRHSFTIIEENDFFAGVSRTDKNYTQGLRLEYHLLQPKDEPWLRLAGFYGADTSFSNGFAIAQEIYTPEIITDPLPQPGDRPYAAWLYVGFITTVSKLDRLWQDTWELDVGVVGPHALGDEIQSGWHELIDADDPTWAGQIRNEGTIGLAWKRQWVHDAFGESTAAWGAKTVTSIGASLGTVEVNASVGALFLFGFHTPADFEAGRGFRPLPDKDVVPLRLYGFAGIEGRFVPWNLFLDGGVFRDGPSISRKYVTADFTAGAVLRLGDRIGVSYAQVFRSGEIDTDPRYHNFGSIALSFTVGY
jgi:lipid A 3-O-deacylase